MRKPYLPKTESGRLAWLTNFNAKLPTYATALALAPSDTAAVAADTAFWTYVLGAQGQIASYAQQWTAYKNSAANGKTPTLGDAPSPPNLGMAPTVVAPGIFNRITTLVSRIKTAPGYTEAIGEALGIIGEEHTVDLDTIKPVINAEIVAGQVWLRWSKQGMDALEIHVDRGAGFVLLAVDTVPDYTDTQPFPASGVWRYKAIYQLHGERVGQWSDIVAIAVAA